MSDKYKGKVGQGISLSPHLKLGAQGPIKRLYWHVKLNALYSLLDRDFTPLSFFVRAESGHKAGALAERYWTQWERTEKGLDTKLHKFPEVMGRGIAISIDEGDWKSYWREALRFGHDKGLEMCLAGDLDDPTVWTVKGLAFDREHRDEADNFDAGFFTQE